MTSSSLPSTIPAAVPTLDWTKIDTVLLDMDGTLLDLHFDNFFWREYLPEHFARLNDLSLQQSQNFLFKRFAETQGTLNWYCLDYWSEQLALDIVVLKKEIEHLIQYRPSAEAFLQKLKMQGKQAVLVTNAHPNSLAIKLDNTNLATYLDQIFSSHQFKLPKEHLGFWNNLQQVLPFDCEKTVLFDDSHAVLESAKAFGINHLLAIEKPDSKGAKTEHPEFTAVSDFNEMGL